MKKLALLFVFVQSLVYAQGEQRYADGTATDQDGNTFEWINYGTQDWAIENAEVVTYRDGTPIPQVTDGIAWENLTTGAWSYYNNNPTKPRLYNWYAVAGIHDNDPNTPNKEFAPEGWHVPSDAEWTTLENYLIANGYNYDGTTTGNKIAKAMASTTGWNSNSLTPEGAVGNDQSLNNSSSFNAFPEGGRYGNASFGNEGNNAIFWSSTEYDSNIAWYCYLRFNLSYLNGNYNFKRYGFSVRFVRDAPNDTEPPVIDILGANPMSINQGESYVELGATATDNVDGNVTPIDINGSVDGSTPGIYNIVYSATDSSGNIGTATRVVIVSDTEPPVITLIGPNPFTVNQGDTYTELGATATDNVDGDLTSSIVVSGTVDTNSPGNYNIKYNVTDSAGNEAIQATRTVVVVETTPTVNAGTDQAICEDETVTLGEATASNVSSVIWTTSGDGTFDNTSIINPTYTPGTQDIINESFRLTLNAQGSNGQVFSDTATLSITSSPTVSAGTNFVINEGETFQLSEATASNYSFVIWTTTGTGAFSNSATINSVYTPSQNDIHTGYVDLIITAHSNAPCTVSVSSIVRVTINPNPTLDAGPDLSVCQGESISITSASASNISSFYWEIVSGTGTLSNTTALSPIYTPSTDDIANGFVTLRLTAYGTNNQQVSDEVYITIEQDHIMQLTSSNTDQLVDENNPISSITFSIGGGATSVTASGLPAGISLTVVDGVVTLSGTPTDDITTQTTYIYTVTTTGNGCTAATYTGTITVNPVEINPTEAGILLNGTVSAENNQIKNVADPTDAQDAVTKTFIENFIKNSVSMEFFEWNISKVNADNQTIQLSSKPFVFVNAANTTIILPDESQVSEMDVIYIYSLRGTNNAPIEDCAITFTSNSHPISSYKLGDGLITASVGQKIYGRFTSSGLKTIVFIDGQWFIGNFSPYSILD